MNEKAPLGFNQETPLGFYDFFARPEQILTSRYTDTLGASVRGNEDAKKFQELFGDAFNHHIVTYLDAEPELKLLLDDPDRFITADSLTCHFLDKLYKLPRIYENKNREYDEQDYIGYDKFLQKITASAVTGGGANGEMFGTNRISFLVGDIGSGKSLLLCKIIRDIIRKKFAVRPQHDYLVLPVYFDFETRMKGLSAELLDIESELFSRLSNCLLEAIQHFQVFREKSTAIVNAANYEYGNPEMKFIALVKNAHDAGIRLLLVLDNIDGYHYYYSKYAFFNKYRERQLQRMKANIGFLSSVLTDGSRLGLLGMSVLIAARHYVFQECLHTNYAESNLKFSGAVYHLETANEVDVVGARMSLLEKAISAIVNHPRLQKVGAGFQDALEPIGKFLGYREDVAALLKEEGHRARPMLKTIRKLSHHGNRGLVTFFSKLRLDYRTQAELVDRFLFHKPHTLVLLYIANLLPRYSQERGHFPNLFLVDGLVQKKVDFEEAHKEHLHTYWLKYLLLSYINAQIEGTVTVGELNRLFVRKGHFDETIFLLALGSLATSEEFGCIEPDPGGFTSLRRVRITERGKALVSQWGDIKAQFCFSFTYLQLVVDDYLMSYPTSMFKKIYVADIDLKYLFEDDLKYSKKNGDYLKAKMRCVLAFLKVLKESYKQEEELRRPLFDHLKNTSPTVLLDFDELKNSLFEQFRRITTAFDRTQQLMGELQRYWDDIERSPESAEQIKRYFSSNAMIEE